MYVFFSSRIARFGTIFLVGLALWAAGAGRAIADDSSDCGCGCNSACDSGLWPPCDPFPRDPWYFSADGTALQRLSRQLVPVASLGVSPTGAIALSQEDLDLPFAAGVQMRVGHNFDDSPFQIEVSYLWLSTWDTSAQVTDPTGQLFSPFTNFGANAPANNFVDNNSSVAIHEISQLESGDINLKYTLPLPAKAPTMMLLFGVRHVAIHEQFDYLSQPTTNVNPVSVHARTNNNLWGPQIGAVMDYGRENTWIHFEGKAALCNNDANRDLDANVNGADANHPRIFTSGTAMVADLSLSVLWHPTSALTTRVGYQVMWCDQLALAANNFATDVASLTNAAAEPPIDAGGHLIYHGPFAGLQLNW